MKKIFLLMILVPVSLFTGAQILPHDIGDTLGPYTVISFEEPTPWITLLPQPGNTWQIGAPHNKPFFNSAFTLPNAIITDTMNPYPVNNASSFELIVGDFNTQGTYQWQIFIDFRHKYDTDTLKDGGYMTVSWDNGLTWTNVIDDSTHFEINPHNGWYIYGNTNLYHYPDVLFNGEHGYSGNSGGWVHSSMAWYYIPVKQKNANPGDTVRFRFNFISDDVHHDREGWMIDQIRLFGMDVGSGIEAFARGKSHSYLFPNPAQEQVTVTCDRTYRYIRFEMVDPCAKVVLSGAYQNTDEFRVNTGNLAPGIYLMKIGIENRCVDYLRLLVTR